VLGQYIRLRPDGPDLEVVGVARDTDVRFIGERDRSFVYIPFDQNFRPQFNVALDSSNDAARDLDRLAVAVAKVDPTVPVVQNTTLSSWLGLWLLPYRILGGIGGAAALVAVTICVVGVYCLVAQVVSKRTHEVGIRLVCGASASSLVGLLAGDVLVIVMVSAAVGLVAARALLAVSRTSTLALYSADWISMIAVASVLVAIGALAAAIPARRATKLEPASAIRQR
jgi:ABC-type antimicrobial peptide transport system permease subunit